VPPWRSRPHPRQHDAGPILPLEDAVVRVSKIVLSHLARVFDSGSIVDAGCGVARTMAVRANERQHLGQVQRRSDVRRHALQGGKFGDPSVGGRRSVVVKARIFDT